jgi:ubiquitin thioesterase OTU1
VCGSAQPAAIEPPAKMDRHIVPADNSCLFTSIGFCADDAHRMGLSSDLRRRVADHIRAHSDKYDEVLLGRPVPEYLRWIADSEHWGGAIECAVLSEVLGLEVVAVDVRAGTAMRFGEDRGYASRIFVCYDGIHCAW